MATPNAGVHFYEIEDGVSMVMPFPIYIRTLDSYEGEFGFDCVRLGAETFDPYNYEDICNTISLLKGTGAYKELSIAKDRSYHIPWLSIFKDHSKIFEKEVILSLKLKSEDLQEDIDKDTKTIKCEYKKQLFTVTPDIYSINDILNGCEITITCENTFGSDETIKLVYREDESDTIGSVVGKMNVYANDDIKELPIRFIKVVDKDESKTYNQRTFADFNDASYDTIKNRIRKKGLNQALISAVFENDTASSIKTLPVDFTDFSNRGLVSQDGGKQPKFGKNIELSNELMMLQDSKFGGFNGLIVFITVIHSLTIELGFAWIIPLSQKTNFIAALGVNSDIVYIHEIGHTLGLNHPFDDKHEYDKNIQIAKENIENMKQNIENMEKNIENRNTYKNQTKNSKETDVFSFPNGDKKTAKQMREEANEKIEEYNGKIEEFNKTKQQEEEKLRDYEIVKNKFSFKKATTNNIMDYNGDRDEGTTNPNPLICFYKYQWDIMRKTVELCYQEKIK